MEEIRALDYTRYFNGWLSDKLYPQSAILPEWFEKKYRAFYKERTSKEEFFLDRPWLPKHDYLYEEYIKEDFRLKDVEIRKKHQEYLTVHPCDLRRLLYEKKSG